MTFDEIKVHHDSGDIAFDYNCYERLWTANVRGQHGGGGKQLRVEITCNVRDATRSFARLSIWNGSWTMVVSRLWQSMIEYENGHPLKKRCVPSASVLADMLNEAERILS